MQNQTFNNPQGGANDPGATIQFDTKGVEFGPWIRRFVAQVRRNWFIPHAAMSFRGHVVIQFNIHKNGRITDVARGAAVVDRRVQQRGLQRHRQLEPDEPLPPEYPTGDGFFTVTFYLQRAAAGLSRADENAAARAVCPALRADRVCLSPDDHDRFLILTQGQSRDFFMRYRVGEFAALTGVTVRALQHYDRLGLLRPSRTESGHRVVHGWGLSARAAYPRARGPSGCRCSGLAEVLDAPASACRSFSGAAREPRTVTGRNRGGVPHAAAARDEAGRREHENGAGWPRHSGRDARHARGDAQLFQRRRLDEVGRGLFLRLAIGRVARVVPRRRIVTAREPRQRTSPRAAGALRRRCGGRKWDRTPRWSVPSTKATATAWSARDRWPRELQRRYAEFRIEAIAEFLGAAAMASWRRNGLVQTYTAGQRSSAVGSRFRTNEPEPTEPGTRTGKREPGTVNGRIPALS